MPITTQCPNPKCLQTFNIEGSIAGRNVKCKKCGTAFRATPTIDGTSSETAPKGPGNETGLFSVLPAEFGRYRVEKLLGKGGMGAVYLATDSQLNRQVALKIPFFDAREEPKRLERFLREARSAARLHHPNICTVYDVGEFQGRPFITMAFITGKPLEDLFDSDNLLPVPQVMDIVRKAALAIQAAHELSIVHRDLKPANIMITPAGEPVIMDFGLAKLVGETDAAEARLTQEGALLGTPKYMAPEQVSGDQQAIGPATDVYALGVILFELLTGKPPYSGPLLQMLSQIASAPVPHVKTLRSEVSNELEAVCRKAMAKKPSERYPGMRELANALSGIEVRSSATLSSAGHGTVAPGLGETDTIGLVVRSERPASSKSKSEDGQASRSAEKRKSPSLEDALPVIDASTSSAPSRSRSRQLPSRTRQTAAQGTASGGVPKIVWYLGGVGLLTVGIVALSFFRSTTVENPDTIADGKTEPIRSAQVTTNSAKETGSATSTRIFRRRWIWQLSSRRS